MEMMMKKLELEEDALVDCVSAGRAGVMSWSIELPLVAYGECGASEHWLEYAGWRMRCGLENVN